MARLEGLGRIVALFEMRCAEVRSALIEGIQMFLEYPLCSMVKFNYHKTCHQASASMDAGRAPELSRY
jgi:hypothetical protein